MTLLIAFLIALLIYQIQAVIYRRYWSKGLRTSMSFEKDVLYEGQDNHLVEIIENRKKLPIPILQVKFSITKTFLFEKQIKGNVTDKYYRSEFFTIMPWQKITRTYPITCSKRGFYTTDSMNLIGWNFFLTEKMIETHQEDVSVCVLPGRIRPLDVPETVNTLLGETEKNLKINEDPFTFAGIREYQPSDNIRSINWKATARHDSLLVNTYNSTFSKRVVLLLNLESNSMQHKDDLAEWAIKITSHLASRYISAGIPTAFYTNGNSPIGCPALDPGADLAHIRAIETALARIDLAIPFTRFTDLMDDRIKTDGHSVEYVIISNYRKKDVTERYEHLLSQGCSIHFVIPSFIRENIEEGFECEKYTQWPIEII